PAGQDPDDVIRTAAAMVGGDGAAQQKAGREAFEVLLANPEPLDARLWRHELEAEALTTPEAWAGLKERLIAHAQTIGHADLARIYREDWLNRFYAQRRPEGAPRAFTPQRRGSFKNGRFVPPSPPVGDKARAISGSGIDPRTARSLLVGFINFPDALPAHAEQLAFLLITDPKIQEVRNELVDRAFSGTTLDRETLVPIFGTLGVA